MDETWNKGRKSVRFFSLLSVFRCFIKVFLFPGLPIEFMLCLSHYAFHVISISTAQLCQHRNYCWFEVEKVDHPYLIHCEIVFVWKLKIRKSDVTLSVIKINFSPFVLNLLKAPKFTESLWYGTGTILWEVYAFEKVVK